MTKSRESQDPMLDYASPRPSQPVPPGKQRHHTGAIAFALAGSAMLILALILEGFFQPDSQLLEGLPDHQGTSIVAVVLVPILALAGLSVGAIGVLHRSRFAVFAIVLAGITLVLYFLVAVDFITHFRMA